MICRSLAQVFMLVISMKKKSTLLTEAIARAEARKYEKKQKADPLVLAIKRNEENLRKSLEEFYLK